MQVEYQTVRLKLKQENIELFSHHSFKLVTLQPMNLSTSF